MGYYSWFTDQKPAKSHALGRNTNTAKVHAKRPYILYEWMVGNGALLWSFPSPFPDVGPKYSLTWLTTTILLWNARVIIFSSQFSTVLSGNHFLSSADHAFCCGISDTSRKGLFPFLSLRHCRPQVLHLEEGPEHKGNTVANKKSSSTTEESRCAKQVTKHVNILQQRRVGVEVAKCTFFQTNQPVIQNAKWTLIHITWRKLRI